MISWRTSKTKQKTTMIMRRIPLFLVVVGISSTIAFTGQINLNNVVRRSSCRHTSETTLFNNNNVHEDEDALCVPTASITSFNNNNNRRSFMETTAAVAATTILTSTTFPQSSQAAEEAVASPPPVKTTDSEGVIMYKTPSSLKYIELEDGPTDSSKTTPRYGQLCVVSYKAYLKLPNSKNKEQFDSASGYIIKHGNGKMVPGLDEGLHTMKVGQLRRVIIPPKLGFVRSGLGPLPEYPWDRYKLNRLLEEMITQRGGNLIYDVRLEDFFDDEADQGYYDDAELSPEEMEIIQNKLIRGSSSSSSSE